MAGVPKDGGHILPWVGTVINCQLLSVLRCQWGEEGGGGQLRLVYKYKGERWKVGGGVNITY